MSHNAEAEAVDLLMEVQQLGKIVNSDPPVVDETNFERVCLYLLRSAEFVSEPEDLLNIFTTGSIHLLFLQFNYLKNLILINYL